MLLAPIPDWLIPVNDINRELSICSLNSKIHHRAMFDCGEPELNNYLQKTAWQHQQKGIANTYVLVGTSDPRRILGFFTLSFLEVNLSDIPEDYGKKLPRSRLPAAKLGRIAIDRSSQGHNYGRLLLVDAIRRVAFAVRTSANVVGLFVDAKNPAVATFYQKFGFIPLEDNPLFLMIPCQTMLAAFPNS
jgi:GNAT superfamily N-acetyltransferase